jgi:hypothetical protein
MMIKEKPYQHTLPSLHCYMKLVCLAHLSIWYMQLMQLVLPQRQHGVSCDGHACSVSVRWAIYNNARGTQFYIRTLKAFKISHEKLRKTSTSYCSEINEAINRHAAVMTHSQLTAFYP